MTRGRAVALAFGVGFSLGATAMGAVLGDPGPGVTVSWRALAGAVLALVGALGLVATSGGALAAALWASPDAPQGAHREPPDPS